MYEDRDNPVNGKKERGAGAGGGEITKTTPLNIQQETGSSAKCMGSR